MVAPLIAAAARKAGSRAASGVKNSKVVRKSRAARNRPELLRKVRARERRRERRETPLTTQEKTAQGSRSTKYKGRAKKLRWLTRSKGKGAGRIKALTALTPILWALAGLYAIQLICATFSIAGYYAQNEIDDFLGGIFSSVLIGGYIFLFFHLLAVVFGIIALFLVMGTYTLRGVPSFRGNGLVILIFTFALTFTPFVILLPIAVIWALIVLKLQK